MTPSALDAQLLLFASAREGDADGIEEALSLGASLWEERDGLTPLKAAVMAGSAPGVEALIRAERDRPRGFLSSLSAQARLAAGRLLSRRPSQALRQFRDPCFLHASSSALLLAVKRQLPEIALALMDHCDPRQADWEGFTPLAVAAALGPDDLLSELLPFSDPSSVDRLGRDPLMLAASAGSPERVSALLPFSDPRRRDSEGSTALIRAAGDHGLNSRAEECVLALAPFSDPDAVNARGESALRAAIRQTRSSECVALLASLSSTETLNRELAWAREKPMGFPSGPLGLPLRNFEAPLLAELEARAIRLASAVENASLPKPARRL